MSTDGATGTIWNADPRTGPNIIGGPNIGGNFWAKPDGNGWSQNHTANALGFTILYNVTDDGLNVDQYPLAIPTPTPTPTPPSPSPGPSYHPSSGYSDIVFPPFPPVTLPYDSTFTGNTIPANMEPGHTYTVGVTVQNMGTTNWSSKNGVMLLSSSSNGFMFYPVRCTIPEGVVVHTGESYTFTVTITVPSSMRSGTYPLRFKLFYTLQTKTGPVEIPFGDALTYNEVVGTPVATVASSVMKGGVKIPTPSPTAGGILSGYAPRQFTTTNPDTVVNRSAIVPGTFIAKPQVMTIYSPGISTDYVNRTVTQNFNARPTFYG